LRLGQALVGAIGAAMIAGVGYRGFFLATGLIPLIWLLPWLQYWTTRDAASGVGEARSAARGAPFSFLQGIALLRHRSVLGIFLGFFAFDYAWFVYVTWLPSYLIIGRKFSTAEMGFYSSVPYLIMMVVILVAGAASDWLVRRGWPERPVRKWFIAAGLLIACLIVPAALVEDRIVSVWLMTISLCGLGIASPNTWTLTQTVCARPIVGTVSGIQNFGGNLGGILAPALTGYTVGVTKSFVLAFTISGAILVGGVLCYWLLISHRVDMDRVQESAA
jgi:ACS family glucarate transporter-like MFS transporter